MNATERSFSLFPSDERCKSQARKRCQATVLQRESPVKIVERQIPLCEFLPGVE